MTPISDTQELARRFNEEEAIWQLFQRKRLTRRSLEADSPLPESVLDHLDWLEAEREIRITRAVKRKWLNCVEAESLGGNSRDQRPRINLQTSMLNVRLGQLE